MFVALLYWRGKCKAKCLFISKNNSTLFFPLPHREDERCHHAPCLFFARSTQADSWQTISRWPHHLSCSFFFFFVVGWGDGGEGGIRWMPWIFAMHLFQAWFYARSFYAFGKGFVWAGSRTDLAWKKVVISCSQAWDCHQIFPIWTYPVLASWHGEGFSIIDKLVIRWEFGLFLSFPSTFPSPLISISSKLCLSFFFFFFPLLDSSSSTPRTWCPWEQNNFSFQ